ncbi:pyruvate, phosphate dikinase [Candidatus Fermentibacteria bacterium]|nr:pyruvate, phosphate dikinase [Candidatus Fermentibacteria bacterium]
MALRWRGRSGYGSCADGRAAGADKDSGGRQDRQGSGDQMSENEGGGDRLLDSLKERAKELSCLYSIEELVRDADMPIDRILSRVVEVMPEGWLHPERCHARIRFEGEVFASDGFVERDDRLTVPISVQDQVLGTIEVSYDRDMPEHDMGPFLKEELTLLKTIAQRIGQTVLHRRLMPVFRTSAVPEKSGVEPEQWRTVMEMLRVTDRDLYVQVIHRMLNYLCFIGVRDVGRILQEVGATETVREKDGHAGINRPIPRSSGRSLAMIEQEILGIAAENMSDELIMSSLRKWIAESKLSFFIEVLEDRSSNLADITAAIENQKKSGVRISELSSSVVRAMNVSLVRRFFSRRLEFIDLAKNVVDLKDFQRFTERLIYPDKSQGYLGGKSAGLFLAGKVIENASDAEEVLKDIKIPKTWYIASDSLRAFVHYNHLEEFLEHKYLDIEQIRVQYPNLISLFKNCSLPPEIVAGLNTALDDMSECPLVVRSSSLLEDSAGAAFSGKYKSLFLGNQGTKQERLDALCDAIMEVYASMFSPDPIQYRAERGLLDFPEEMGILIQEVVGSRVGDYWFPAFAGVAFSNSEFRWSPRIEREDGLARMVPGLGTRAVDRLSDDYPVLMAPGKPQLKVNVSIDEVVRYSPRYMDVINLKTNSIETIEMEDLLRELGTSYPRAREIFSVLREDMLVKLPGLVDFEKIHPVATFESLISDTGFVSMLRRLLSVLQRHYNLPVDVEFAVDESNFYLLQCRVQSSRLEEELPDIPSDLPEEQVVFEANKHISNGYVSNVTHIVYVVPSKYDQLEDRERLQEVGRVVGRLNRLLPKKQFILIGPGRWGSRGDIKLGVSVTYSEISNTAALLEVAYRKGSYVPDLSFGTHFFQDLVEASIAYLPLYPDQPGAVYNEKVLEESPSILSELLPDAADIEDVVRVIDTRSISGGDVLHIIMNADESRAVAFMAPESPARKAPPIRHFDKALERPGEEHWVWRQRMAEKLAEIMDAEALGVSAIYLFGSTKNASAGPCSDIDLLIHFRGNDEQKSRLLSWLDGWSICLGEINRLRTGYDTERLLDVHLVTDEDVRQKTGYASKIGAVTDAARPLRINRTPKDKTEASRSCSEKA